jgi:hypothetical protein
MRTMKLALALAVAGCAAQKTSHELASVGVALTTTGQDGGTYRLQQGTRLSFNATSPTQSPNYDVNLDGDGNLTFKVVPGTYAATLYLSTDPPNFTRTEWRLERTVNGVTDTITAELVTPQGSAMTVTEAGPNNLVFQFKTLTGTIVFGRAPVDVSIGVSPATNFTASESGSGVTGIPAFGGPYAAGLQALLPGAGTTLNITIAGHMTGPWVDTGGTIDPPDQGGVNLSVCAPIALDSLSGGDQAGFLALIAEANHGGAPNYLFGQSDICIIDRGTFSQVWMRVAREGTADTVAFQTAFAPDNPAAVFYIRVVGDLPTRVYNSDTGELDSNALLGTQSLPMTDLHLVVRSDVDQSIWYNSRPITGTETFIFSAQ